MTEYSTPTARIVFGDPFKSRPVTDSQTNHPKLKKDNTPRVSWSFGLAVPKAQASEMVAVLKAAAAEIFPNGTPPDFAWKVKDGDTGIDDKGKPYRDREGWAGCYVFSLSTEYQAPLAHVYDHAAGNWKQVEGGIKSGDHVQVALDVKAHPAVGRGKPGLYLNPKAVFLYKVDKQLSRGVAVDVNKFAPPPQQAPGSAPSAPQQAAPTGGNPFGASQPRHDTFAHSAPQQASEFDDSDIPF